MNVVGLSAAKKYSNQVAAGFSSVEVDGMNINFTLNDGKKAKVTVPKPADGISIADVDVNSNNELIITLSDNSVINAGVIKTLKGDNTPIKGVDYFTQEELKGVSEEASVLAVEEARSVATQLVLSSIDTHDNSDNSHQKINNKINEVRSVAEGASLAVVKNSYEELVTDINAIAANVYGIGRSFLIKTIDVPDLWVSQKFETSEEYTYTTDEAITNALKTSGYFRVGYYEFSALETQKVDLTEYYTKEQVNALLPKTKNESTYNEEYVAGELSPGIYFLKMGV